MSEERWLAGVFHRVYSMFDTDVIHGGVVGT